MRFKIIKTLFLLFLAAITIRLFYWQVIKGDDLSARAEQQHFVSRNLEGQRGLIISSDGAVLVANKPAFFLFGLPQVIKDKQEVSEKLAKVLSGVGAKDFNEIKKDLFAKLSQNLYWVALSKNLDLTIKKEIEKLNLSGIDFEDQTVRYYPEASSAAHLLGFVGADSLGKPIGYFGIEGFYDRELKGQGGVLTEEKDALGVPILIGKFFRKDPKSGHNLILNIDRTIQYIVEKSLKRGIEKYGAKSGLVVVMNPDSGAILAMASFPNYEPNRFVDFSKELFRNPVVADSFEPGSIFKVLVMAAAINENLVKPDTYCDQCNGPVEIGDYLVRTWNNKYYPDTNMSDVIVHSDNIGMVFVGRKLGLDKLYRYLQDFGFGRLTQIDLQDETSPDLRSKDQWREIDLATVTFGQGIAVTPIQIIRAISTIANGGSLLEPHVVQSVQMGDKLAKIKPKVVGQPIKSETAKIVTEMMVEAVDKGEAKVFAQKGFRIAGKTGTAQIPVAGHYDPTKTIASFIGFAPADNPKFAMLVSYNEPSVSIFGSETAAPTFFEIAKELLIYYSIAPSQ